MIDPRDVIKYDRSDEDLLEFLIFSICVAGKKASVIAKKVHQLREYSKELGYDSLVCFLDNENPENYLVKFKIGQYKKLSNCFNSIVKSIMSRELDIRNCDVDELEKFKGIGPKTSRYFILYSQPNKEYAVLDTHILKWLGTLGYSVPKSTPTKNKYKELEKIFLNECRIRNKKPSDLDLEIWNSYSK